MSLVADDSRTMHDKKIDAGKRRIQNREFKIRSKDQIGKKVDHGRQVLSYYAMLGIEITEQDIIDDSMDSLAGNLIEISQEYWLQRRKFEMQSVGKNAGAVARLRTKLLGELPTTLAEFETHEDDIRAYQSTFLTSTQRKSSETDRERVQEVEAVSSLDER